VTIVARFAVESLHHPDAPGIEVVDPILVVAGFTGRDRSSVEHHIAELEGIGIPRPSRVPTIFVLPNWLLQVDPQSVDVASPRTSGETEPVLIRQASGELYLTVGSDHTDRGLEQMSFGAAKQTCPKVLSGRAWPLQEVEDLWDDIVLSSTVDGGASYQNERASGLIGPRDTLSLVSDAIGPGDRPLVLFLGTVPLLHSMVYSTCFDARLAVGGRELRCRYQVRPFDPLDAAF
jgi:hypothetical protein